MVSEPRTHIEHIRKDFQASQRVKDSLNNSIQALAHDLYSKETHFIFELIQNAEDNTYKETEPSLSFRLVKTDPTNTQNAIGALIIQNNEIGFSPDDVDAICAVGKTTKNKIKGYIGEKGIGFKSVFRITTMPHIFSGSYQFCLPEKDKESGLGYIVPRWIERPPKGIDPCHTTIILPLDKPDFGYERIEEMLQDIEPETILFLSKLKEVQIKTDTGDRLTILKDKSQEPLVQILIEGEQRGKSLSSIVEFLLYSKFVDKPEDVNHEKRIGIDKRDVSIAFPLDENQKSAGKIFAYLPIRSDTGLPFLINADFILPSSREEIRGNVPWNLWLMDCVADILADALPQLKKEGLLTVDLLEALAKRMNEIDENSMFHPIVEAVSDALMDQELLPSDDGAFVFARNAKLARGAELRKLLTHNQLRKLFQSKDDIKCLSEKITQDLTPDLRFYLMSELDVEEITPEGFARKIELAFLENQSDEWMVTFYRFLNGQKALWESRFSPLRKKPFIRLQPDSHRSHVRPFRQDGLPNAYRADEANTDTSLPIVKVELSKHKDVQQFLSRLGLPELDIVAEVVEKILPKYSQPIPIDEHRRDLAKIERAYATDSQEKKRRLREQLQGTPFIFAEKLVQETPNYFRPAEAYFRSDDLEAYFSGSDKDRFVRSDYAETALEIFKDLGVTDQIRIKCKSKNGSAEYVQLEYKYAYRRGLKGFDPDIQVDGLEHAIINPSIERSEIIWNKIAIKYSHCIKGEVLRSSRQDFSPYASTYKKDEITSNFGQLLIDKAWLPGLNGNFVKPSDLSLDDLPDSFIRDEKLADQIEMKKDVVAKLAEEAGVSEGDIVLLKQHPEEFKEWKDTISAKKEKPAFPTKSVTNPGRRRKKLLKDLDEAPEKQYEPRTRSVRITQASQYTRTWLKEQYTDELNQMFCQVCKEEMPFKKRDDEYYFEAVEALSRDHFAKEHEAQFLALCPLCAAMYNEFVKHDQRAMESLKNALMNSEDTEVSLQLGEMDTSVRFVESHFLDIKTIIEAQE